MTKTAFGTVKYYWVSATSETITPSAVTSCAIPAGTLNLIPHKVTFTTSTKNTNYTVTYLTMKGVAEDETTVLWTKLIGIMDVSVHGTVGNTAEFIIDDTSCIAPYLQFELTGLTGITKQTVAGTITIDYFNKIEYQNRVGQKQPATLPIIVGNLGNVRTNGAGQNKVPTADLLGAFNGTKTKSAGGDQSGEGRWAGWYDRVTFDASRCSDVYSGTYNRPESLATQYLIKYA